MYRDQGHSSITVLLMMMVLSIMLIGTSMILRPALLASGNYRQELELSTQQNQRVTQLIQALQDDDTPQSHSLDDSVWELISQWQEENLQVELSDISSRLNPNWLRWKLFDETYLTRLIISGQSPDQLQELRYSDGFSKHLQTWEETFGQENLDSYFTLYSWANINVTQEAALEELYILRYGENGASAFRSRIQQGLRDFTLWESDQLPQVMGTAAESLYPVINAYPLMNVHFIDPFLLECLLSYPYREDPLENPQGITQAIVTAREQGEITPERLKSLINPNEKQLRILEYLGTQTWFWEYSERHGETLYRWIICFDGVNWTVLEKGQEWVDDEVLD